MKNHKIFNALHEAIKKTTYQGIMTRDIGGSHDTVDVTNAIIENIKL